MHENNLNVDIFTTFDEIEYLRTDWDNFVKDVNGDIYLTFDWCKTWWKFYGTDRRLQLFIYTFNNDIVGIFPLFYEIKKMWVTWIKIAKFVGSDSTTSFIHIPINNDFHDLIFKSIVDILFDIHNCDALWLGPLRFKDTNAQQLRSIISHINNATLIKHTASSQYTAFCLPSTYDEYLRSLNKRQRNNIKRDLNLINKSFDVTSDIISDITSAEKEFTAFVHMHTEQWKAVGKLGHFLDWPYGVEFNSTLVKVMAKRGRLRIVRLLFNGNVVSYQLCFTFGKRWYWRLPARVTGASWNKFSLGRIGLIKEIELAISEGASEIEAGVGHYEYKVKLGGKEMPLHTFFIVRNGVSSRLRAMLFIKLSETIHLFYYRIWFNRIASKLPFNQPSLSKLWIRTKI